MAEPASPVKVLLIEDDEADVTLLRTTLKLAKVHVDLTVVPDGEKALSFLRREPPYAEAARPDLVLLDLNLPKVGGLEVLKALRADSEMKLVPVIVLTTSSAPSDVLKAYDLQANCYLTKPLTLESFMEMVRAFDDFWLTLVKLPSRCGP